MQDTSATDLVRSAFSALASGDFDTLAASFAPDARWRAVDDGPWPCEGRAEIVAFMRRHRRDGAGGTIARMEQLGDALVVGFRPDPDPEGERGERPLDGGLAYIVVTVRDGLITELKGCADRAAALAYAGSV